MTKIKQIWKLSQKMASSDNYKVVSRYVLEKKGRAILNTDQIILVKIE